MMTADYLFKLKHANQEFVINTFCKTHGEVSGKDIIRRDYRKIYCRICHNNRNTIPREEKKRLFAKEEK